MKLRYLITLALVIVLLVFAFSCSVDKDIELAEKAVNASKDVHAEYLAPYEYSSAEVYLEGAKREVNKSNYFRAKQFANKATQQANMASVIARKKNSEPQIPYDQDRAVKIMNAVEQPKAVEEIVEPAASPTPKKVIVVPFKATPKMTPPPIKAPVAPPVAPPVATPIPTPAPTPVPTPTPTPTPPPSILDEIDAIDG